MNRRRFLQAVSTGLLAAPAVAGAQQAGKVYRIGYLSTQSASTGRNYLDAFRQGLRDLGYLEGRNLAIEYRWGAGNYQRLPGLASELTGLQLVLIVSVGGPPAARALKEATTTPART
jgi:putative ABC transport system substrate-binding protein